ncbi:unnamed protein product, partial [Hapterophycus canaliculatus]
LYQALVAKGIKVDEMHPDGVSALMYAAAGGHPEVVKVLLNGEGPGKADPNLKHRDCIVATRLLPFLPSASPPLQATILTSRLVDVCRTWQGGTALMEAATSGSQEVVDLLLAAGADPLVRDKDGVSPLMSAAAQVGA